MGWTKEQKAEYMKKYRLENKERLLKRAREYKKENKESVCAKKKEWNEKNKTKALEQRKTKYRESHPKKTPKTKEQRREKKLEGYRKNRDKRVAYSMKYEKEHIKSRTKHTAWRYFHRMGIKADQSLIESKTKHIELTRAIKAQKESHKEVTNG